MSAPTWINPNKQVSVLAAAYQVGSAPSSGAFGYVSGKGRVRTLITYAGTVTSARLRIYTRRVGGTTWFRGASSDDIGPLQPSASMLAESLDWDIGSGTEFLFVLEATTPASAGNTVQVDVVGVSL